MRDQTPSGRFRPHLIRGSIVVAITIAVTMLAMAATPPSQTPAKSSAVVWDEAGARNLEAAYHTLHEYWNAMDVPKLKSVLVGDEKLATFDIDPDTLEPVKLRTKADIDRFTDQIFNGFKGSEIKTVAEHPMIACRVSGSLGVCTEECRIQLFLPDGTKQIQKLRGTAVAVNDAGTWRFIEWHMSPSGPIEAYDREGKRVDTAVGGR